MPIGALFWGIVALVLVYSAYVSEVYRAGIESVHPSQRRPPGRSASRTHALRFVILPQAVRRVIPPLLNDFIGLQKDTALVGLLGVVEAFRQSQIEVGDHVRLHAVRRDGDPLHPPDHPARPADRLARGRDRRRQLAAGGAR